MRRWRYLQIAAVLAVLHLILALGSVAVGFSIGIRRWNVGSAAMLESAANGGAMGALIVLGIVRVRRQNAAF